MRNRRLNRHLLAAAIAIIIICVPAEDSLATENVLKMSTTTSTRTSGLLDVLLPSFEQDTGIRVKVFAKGTGAAIRDGIDGNVDVIFVHARARETKFVKDGYGTKRYAVMHNDFIILGPSNDPAGIKGIKEASAALEKIAAGKALFVSRGDDSGTHTMEQILWRATGLALNVATSIIVKKGKKSTVEFLHPQGSEKWYLSIGQGMGRTITFADEKRAYTLADRGTYIKYRYGRAAGLDLEIMCAKDPLLSNPYGVIPVNPARHPHVRYGLARQFAKWLVSVRAQSLISNYRLQGKQLFYPDAITLVESNID